MSDCSSLPFLSLNDSVLASSRQVLTTLQLQHPKGAHQFDIGDSNGRVTPKVDEAIGQRNRSWTMDKASSLASSMFASPRTVPDSNHLLERDQRGSAVFNISPTLESIVKNAAEAVANGRGASTPLFAGARADITAALRQGRLLPKAQFTAIMQQLREFIRTFKEQFARQHGRMPTCDDTAPELALAYELYKAVCVSGHEKSAPESQVASQAQFTSHQTPRRRPLPHLAEYDLKANDRSANQLLAAARNVLKLHKRIADEEHSVSGISITVTADLFTELWAVFWEWRCSFSAHHGRSPGKRDFCVVLQLVRTLKRLYKALCLAHVPSSSLPAPLKQQESGLFGGSGKL